LNSPCNEFWEEHASFLLPAGGALYIQRAGIKAVGEDTDSHDDFRPVHRDSASVPSVHELIEKVKWQQFLLFLLLSQWQR